MLAGGEVAFRGRSVRLTKSHCAIMRLLVDARGKCVRHDAVYNELYGLRADCDMPEDGMDCIKSLVWGLRKRLEGSGLRIESRHGLGYSLQVAA